MIQATANLTSTSPQIKKGKQHEDFAYMILTELPSLAYCYPRLSGISCANLWTVLPPVVSATNKSGYTVSCLLISCCT